VKITLITFFDIKGIFHFEFIPQDQTVNQTHYVKILEWLHESVRRKSSELWPKDWILHHDNAPAHKALPVKQFLAQNSITCSRTSTLFPSFAPNDFWLFP